MSAEKIAAIEGIEGEGIKSQSIKDMVKEKLTAAVGPAGQDFEALMKRLEEADGKQNLSIQTDNQAQGLRQAYEPSPIDEIGRIDGVQAAQRDDITPQSIAKSADHAREAIAQIEMALSDPNLELKGSVKQLLENKLEHINDNLRVAAERSGTEMGNLEIPERVNPVNRFLGMLNYSQNGLANISTRLNSVAQTGDLPFTAMMAVQIKMNTITQEVEFFTSLLSKAIEGTKTIMNVQV